MNKKKPSSVVVLDFGSQYTQLIARRVREFRVFSEILPYNTGYAEILQRNPQGIILSGGPASVTSNKSPACDARIFELGIPVLGICYGMQLMGSLRGGKVKHSGKREFGHALLSINRPGRLFEGLPGKLNVWMSHSDKVIKLPPGFTAAGHTSNSSIAAMSCETRGFYGVQFHPEVAHTSLGREILKNFVFKVCGCRADWTMKSFIEQSVMSIREQVGKEKVICALSGGVDSSVLAVLLNRAVRKNLTCIFVNNGLLRKGEEQNVIWRFRNYYKMRLIYADAGKIFLKKLKGVTDPEKKRKIIGREFIEVFDKQAKKMGSVKFLSQGTLYPDVIESRSPTGSPSATIKSHHNVGGLPERMKMKLVEPFRELFKDEVRLIGRELGLPDELVWRQPFPGPGLAVRIIGKITRERLSILREADAIVIEESKKADLYRKIWQSFAVLLPLKTVGVMGDERTYEHVIAVRAVISLDGMTADWAKLPPEFLGRVSNRIINEVKGVNRVVYDISSKPPSTIEWE